jgi:hypothetical protein
MTEFDLKAIDDIIWEILQEQAIAGEEIAKIRSILLSLSDRAAHLDHQLDKLEEQVAAVKAKLEVMLRR